MGIKIELARVLAEYGRADKAIEVLEHVLDEMVVAAAAAEKEEAKDAEAERARLLKRAVFVAAKISNMYLDIDRPGQAEEPLVWAVDTALAESRKLVKHGGKRWMEDKEMAMVLENLATLYEKTDRFALASPLYLLALEYMPPGDCHSVILSIHTLKPTEGLESR